jgi:hypothetical protein
MEDGMDEDTELKFTSLKEIDDEDGWWKVTFWVSASDLDGEYLSVQVLAERPEDAIGEGRRRLVNALKALLASAREQKFDISE